MRITHDDKIIGGTVIGAIAGGAIYGGYGIVAGGILGAIVADLVA